MAATAPCGSGRTPAVDSFALGWLLQQRFSFVVFDVPDTDARLILESRVISTVSLCADCRPSSAWLGLNSPKAKIRGGGLWLVNELGETPLTDADVQALAAALR
jgi:hypothetical protein